jgi:hypothetical protein
MNYKHIILICSFLIFNLYGEFNSINDARLNRHSNGYSKLSRLDNPDAYDSEIKIDNINNKKLNISEQNKKTKEDLFQENLKLIKDKTDKDISKKLKIVVSKKSDKVLGNKNKKNKLK